MVEPRVDDEAELATLGAAYDSPQALALARATVQARDFADPARREVFDALCRMSDAGVPIDRVTLGAELRRDPKRAWVLERFDLSELALGALGSERVEAHARIVAEHAEARRYREAAEKILRAANDGGMSLAALRGLAADEIGKVQARAAAASGPRPFADLAAEYYARLEASLTRVPGTIDGLPTGLADLDALLSGLHGGELILLGARPRVGKSALVVQMAVAAARHTSLPVLGFSLEMSAVSLFARAAHGAAGVEASRAREARLTQEDMTALTGAINELAALSVYIDDAPGTTVLDIRAKSLALRARAGGLAMVFCDYTQLLESHNDKGNRQLDVSSMSRALKQLARELDVPVVALSQLKREVDTRPDKRPVLADLRESGSLEQDADVVIFLYRDVLYDPKTPDPFAAEVIVAKQRNGPTDTVRARWEGAFTRFADLEPAEPEPPQDNAYRGDTGGDDANDW